MDEHDRPRHDFARALATMRSALGVSQEAFHSVSGRTYVSAVERGLKVPTLSKIDDFAGVLDVNPLTLLALSYSGARGWSYAIQLLDEVKAELASVRDRAQQE